MRTNTIDSIQRIRDLIGEMIVEWVHYNETTPFKGQNLAEYRTRMHHLILLYQERGRLKAQACQMPTREESQAALGQKILQLAFLFETQSEVASDEFELMLQRFDEVIRNIDYQQHPPRSEYRLAGASMYTTQLSEIYQILVNQALAHRPSL